jgi:hypothetical protein
MIRNMVQRLPLVRNRLPSLSMLAARDQRKYWLAWIRSRRKDYLLDERLPWITFDAIRFLQTQVKPGIRVFEYGSGGSTLFWTRFGAHCTTIESDAEWETLIRGRLTAADDVDLRLVPGVPPKVNAALDLDSANPESYATDWPAFENWTFVDYVCQIDSFPDGYFDVILVDGHARASCIKHSYRKVKPGGILILDNADIAPYLSQTQDYLNGFERHRFYGIGPINGILWQTDIYLLKT